MLSSLTHLKVLSRQCKSSPMWPQTRTVIPVTRGRTKNISQKHQPPTRTQTTSRHYSSVSKTNQPSLDSPTFPSAARPTPQPFSMSQKAPPAICCKVLQITPVYVHVFCKDRDPGHRSVITLHLLYGLLIQTHASLEI